MRTFGLTSAARLTAVAAALAIAVAGGRIGPATAAPEDEGPDGDMPAAGAPADGPPASTPAAASTSPSKKPATKSRKIEERLTLAATPDLPGTMHIDLGPDARGVPVRVLAIVDERLLAAPFHRVGDHSFEASFPSPWKSLEYQIQVRGNDGRTALSEREAAKVECRSTNQLVTRLQKQPVEAEREKLLREAVLLDDDIRRIEWIAKRLRSLALEPEANR